MILPNLQLHRYCSSISQSHILKRGLFARSWFFPKKSRSGLEKADTLGADVVVLDLEDSVAAQEKSAVRSEYVRALDDGVFTRSRVFVRVSDLSIKGEVKEDLKALTRLEVSGFMLPKLKHPDEVLEIDELLSAIEKERNLPLKSMKLVPMLELPEAHFQSDAIVSCSQRNVCILAGSGDFTAYTVCDDHSPTYNAFFSAAVMAAKAAGIEAVCGVHDRIDDYAGLEKFCREMKKSGYMGALALTSKQIHIVNNAFSYSPRELMWIDQALEKNGPNNIKVIQPSVQESRQMIGPPHKEKAKFMKERHEAQMKLSSPTKKNSGHTILGKMVNKGLDPDTKLGEIVFTPTEVTISDTWKYLWESAFLSTKGYFTSLPRANLLGFDRIPLPFSLIATMAIAFSVSNLSYYARVHLGFKNMFQHRPLLAGDTIRAMFSINSIEDKKCRDGNQYCITNSTHWVMNQHKEVVFQVDKDTMFAPSHCNIDKTIHPGHQPRLDPKNSILCSHLLKQPEASLVPQMSVPELIPGQVLVHDFVKVMGESEVRMLCTLLGLVNPHHHNKVRYHANDLLVPGPFVMSAALSASTLDVGEIVYEDIPYCSSPNKVNFGDQIGAITYIESCESIRSCPHLEEVKVKHLALKNTDMEILSEMNIPSKLFESTPMKPSEYEVVCMNEIPMLLHKIVCVVDRKIIRVHPGLVKNNNNNNP